MSIQAIIDRAEEVTINRRKVVGQAVTRNEIVRVSEAMTRNPWRLTVKCSAPIPYYDARPIIEQLDKIDRAQYEDITFSSNPKLDWMLAFDHTNQISPAAISSISISTSSGNVVTITGLPPVADTTLMFRKGDFVQIGSNFYPFTVTADVYRGTGGTANLTLHRPVFFNVSPGTGITVGNNVKFRMIATSMPAYTIIRGASTGLVVFNGNFELIEFTGGVL